MSPYFQFGPMLAADYQVGQNASNITICPFGVRWIWVALGDCVSSPREKVSAYLGLVSLATWMLVGIPQVIKNFRNIDGLAGISFFLLLQWTGGDLTNLVGAILTSQLKLQIYLACYFVLTDIVLMAQYTIFILRKKRKREAELRAAADPAQRLILCLMGLVVFSQGICNHIALPSSLKAVAVTENHHTFEGHMSRSLLSVNPDRNGSVLYTPEKKDHQQMVAGLENDLLGDTRSIFWHDRVSIAGYVIGILSSVFYLGSRLAQIYKNRRLQSTQGLAVLTFLLAVFGNLTYGAQILARDVSSEFLLEKTPWLIGSLGIVGFDCVLLFQFRYYSYKNRDMQEMSRALLDNEYIINAEDGDNNGYIY